MNHALRFGNFTSSEIGALMTEGKKAGSFGAPALTYIEERNMERRLGRALKGDTEVEAMDWGHLCESYVFQLLGLEYSTQSKQTLVHPDFDCWAGTPDSVCYGTVNAVVDIKAPYTLKSFCQLVDGWKSNGIQGVRDNHKLGEKYYWQIVSNAILTGCDEGELIVFCPMESEINSLFQMGLSDYGWLTYAKMESLPWIPNGNENYKSLNKFRFAIPADDKKVLIDRVAVASELLIERKVESLT